ncbi:MAG: HK97 gp10 family phage protein [Phycisphaerae bacterium]
MEVALKVEGAREIRRRLAALPRTVEKRIVRRAVREGAKIVREEAERRCPVATGRLRRTLTQRKGRQRRGSYTVAVQHNWKRYYGQVPFYGGFVEYGTRRMPARPYMRPAADAKQDEAGRAVIQSLQEGIEREAAKMRGG